MFNPVVSQREEVDRVGIYVFDVYLLLLHLLPPVEIKVVLREDHPGFWDGSIKGTGSSGVTYGGGRTFFRRLAHVYYGMVLCM